MRIPQDIELTSEGERIAAWRFAPEGDGPHPTVILGHGLAAVKEMRLDAYAERFCAAGFLCVAFDYRHFGASGGTPRQILSTSRQRADWHAVIDQVREMPEVDPDRLAIWGSSYGGGHALAVGADRDDLLAVVAQCPFTDGLASALAADPLSTFRVGLKGTADLLLSVVGAGPVYGRAVSAPGGPSFMQTPDAYLGLVPSGYDYDNRVAGRFAYDILRQFPGRRMKDLTCPTLICICDRDEMAPATPTARYAARNALVETAHYDTGHFGIYTGEWFERVVTDQIAFLKRACAPRPSEAPNGTSI